MNEEQKAEIPEGMKLVESRDPAEKQAPERTLEDNFPLKDFTATIAVLFKHSINGGPAMLRIVGDAWLAGEIMKGGRHQVEGANGHAIVFNGNDVLWAECVTAQENRDRAIAQARAQLEAAEVEAKAREEKLAADKAKADKAKAEETKAALEAIYKVKKPRGILGWFERDRKG